jgi:hypothetical protein
MARVHGAPAGGNLVRGLRTAGVAGVAAFVLTACMADAGRIDDGTYYGPDTEVTTAQWGIVERVQSLADGTVAASIASCLLPPGGQRHIGTQEELTAVSQNPNGGVELMGDGLVTASDGQVYSCGTDIRAPESSGYANGQVVLVPPQPTLPTAS